jgi:Fe2+ transport system protein FeoA
VARMSAMGLRAGARLRMLQPGSPCLLEVGTTRLSLRPESGFSVLVLPLSSVSTRR